MAGGDDSDSDEKTFRNRFELWQMLAASATAQIRFFMGGGMVSHENISKQI